MRSCSWSAPAGRSTRDDRRAAELIGWGPGPRASQALMLACACPGRCSQGRLAPSVEDVVALARPVLRHRMALTFAARADGVTLDQIIERLLRGDRRLMAAAAEFEPPPA